MHLQTVNFYFLYLWPYKKTERPFLAWHIVGGNEIGAKYRGFGSEEDKREHHVGVIHLIFARFFLLGFFNFWGVKALGSWRIHLPDGSKSQISL